MNPKLVKTSKFISLVLRHRPDKIGLKIDSNGWAKVGELLEKASISFEDLCEIVDTNEKKRFAFNSDKTLIRASQGHSICVDLEMKAVQPPDVLYHGTAEKNLKSIMDGGLKKMNRNHVHLSKDWQTAYNVGIRHGKPVILSVDSKTMYSKGYKFYLSENGVWLTNCVPSRYLEVGGETNIKNNPECDGFGWTCDSCGRRVVGCGKHPFEPVRTRDYLGAVSTDPYECRGYI